MGSGGGLRGQKSCFFIKHIAPLASPRAKPFRGKPLPENPVFAQHPDVELKAYQEKLRLKGLDLSSLEALEALEPLESF